MKRLLLILSVVLPLFVSVGCSDDDSETNSTKTLMVNVFVEGDLASPTLVRLYDYEDAKDFDKNATYEMGDKQELISESGEVLTPLYTSDSHIGVNTFEGIEDGTYMLIVFHKPEGFSFPNFYYYGYKQIVVNESNDAKLYKIDFNNEDRGKFIQF